MSPAMGDPNGDGSVMMIDSKGPRRRFPASDDSAWLTSERLTASDGYPITRLARVHGAQHGSDHSRHGRFG
jgi:hypothetical protein